MMKLGDLYDCYSNKISISIIYEINTVCESFVPPCSVSEGEGGPPTIPLGKLKIPKKSIYI